jgi:hypothetical protein
MFLSRMFLFRRRRYRDVEELAGRGLPFQLGVVRSELSSRGRHGRDESRELRLRCRKSARSRRVEAPRAALPIGAEDVSGRQTSLAPPNVSDGSIPAARWWASSNVTWWIAVIGSAKATSPHSRRSSAWARIACGTVRKSAFAVVRLITTRICRVARPAGPPASFRAKS